jgi:hypothetical protein
MVRVAGEEAVRAGFAGEDKEGGETAEEAQEEKRRR